MPDFDAFSLLEFQKRKSRSHGKIKKRQIEMTNTKDVLLNNLTLPLMTYQ